MTGWGKEWNKPVWPTQDNTGKAISKEQAKAAEEEFKIISDSMQAVGEGLWPAMITEEDKAWADANLHGTGFTQDGKHVALNKIFIDAVENAEKEVNDLALNIIPKIYNQIPTHDPYTNPGAYLYYECKCGQRLDPHTKRFAELNNAAMKAGWKIRWGANSYVPYCVECGKDVE